MPLPSAVRVRDMKRRTARAHWLRAAAHKAWCSISHGGAHLARHSDSRYRARNRVRIASLSPAVDGGTTHAGGFSANDAGMSPERNRRSRPVWPVVIAGGPGSATSGVFDRFIIATDNADCIGISAARHALYTIAICRPDEIPPEQSLCAATGTNANV